MIEPAAQSDIWKSKSKAKLTAGTLKRDQNTQTVPPFLIPINVIPHRPIAITELLPLDTGCVSFCLFVCFCLFYLFFLSIIIVPELFVCLLLEKCKWPKMYNVALCCLFTQKSVLFNLFVCFGPVSHEQNFPAHKFCLFFFKYLL